MEESNADITSGQNTRIKTKETRVMLEWLKLRANCTNAKEVSEAEVLLSQTGTRQAVSENKGPKTHPYKILKGSDLDSFLGFNNIIYKRKVLTDYAKYMASVKFIPIFTYEDTLSSSILAAFTNYRAECEILSYFYRVNQSSTTCHPLRWYEPRMLSSAVATLAVLYLARQDKALLAKPNFRAIINRRIFSIEEYLRNDLPSQSEIARRYGLVNTKARYDTGGILAFLNYQLHALKFRRLRDLAQLPVSFLGRFRRED